jgi:lantibiotic modifying enzyme
MSSDCEFLDAAARIGRHVVAAAIWHNGRCNWVGARRDTTQPWSAEYRALESDVYGGTAGVGLFLAQFAAITGDDDARRTAVGALRQSVAQVEAMPSGRRDGFHAGSLGVAWAAARAAVLLAEERLLDDARIALRLPRPATPDRRPDVGPGTAGTVLALLALSDMLEDLTLVDSAFAAGELLLHGATVTRHGWSWPVPERRRRYQLCGLSHGAAGIGWALFELAAATGDHRFRTSGEGAFEYERRWLDSRTGTWPDLRSGGSRRGEAPRGPSPRAGSWCHGEGGIALTRLRACALLDSPRYLEEAEIALASTHRTLADVLSDDVRDLSLCHGAAGAADVVQSGAAALPDRWTEPARLALELGRAVLDRHSRVRDLPCGAAAGVTPALLRGLSGIGWWFLRLHDDAVQSPLTMPIARLTLARQEA